METKGKVIAASAAIAFTLSAGTLAWPYYSVSQQASAFVLWNATEADLFIDVGRVGWETNRAGVLIDALKSQFWISTPPDRKVTYHVVLKITADAVSEETLKDSQLSRFVPIGPDWTWTPKGFQPTAPISETPLRSPEGAQKLQYVDVNGWSRQAFLFGNQKTLRFSLSGQPTVLRFTDDLMIQRVFLQTGDQSERLIWKLDRLNRRVSPDEYRGLFYS